MIYDTSRSKCSLPHHAPIVRMSSGSRQVPIKQFANPRVTRALSDPNNVPPLIPHGAIAEVYLLWGNWCANPATALTLRFGHGMQVTARLKTQPSCTNYARPTTFATSHTLTRS